MADTKKFHSGMVQKQVLINATHNKVWKKISNIVGLPEWIDEIKKGDLFIEDKVRRRCHQKVNF